jgi:hypothetical protein
MTASRLSSTTSFCELPLAFGRCAFLTALPTAARISSKKGSRSGAFPSDVIGM